MKILSAFWILFFLTFKTNGQPETFIKKYDVCKDLGGHFITEDSEGYTVFADNFGSAACLGFLKIDKSGTPIYEKAITSDQYHIDTDAYNSAIQVDSGAFVFAAAYRTPGTWVQNIGFNYFDPRKPDSLVTKLMLGTDLDEPRTIQKTKKGFLIYGERNHIEVQDDGRGIITAKELAFWELDSLGNFIQKIILPDTFKYASSRKMEVLPGGDILICYIAGEFISRNDAFLTLLDENYNVKWTNKIEGQFTAVSCAAVGDNRLYFSASGRFDDIALFNQSVVYVFNEDGDMIWIEFFDFTGTRFEIFQLRATTDGEMLGCGWHPGAFSNSAGDYETTATSCK